MYGAIWNVHIAKTNRNACKAWEITFVNSARALLPSLNIATNFKLFVISSWQLVTQFMNLTKVIGFMCYRFLFQDILYHLSSNQTSSIFSGSCNPSKRTWVVSCCYSRFTTTCCFNCQSISHRKQHHVVVLLVLGVVVGTPVPTAGYVIPMITTLALVWI